MRMLSPRELEVLVHCARGLTSKEIAAECRISRHTVEQHITNAVHKLGARARVDAVAKATARGLIHRDLLLD